ncbi:hypothetical protein ACCT09_37230, partial [Rhizobium ruizarguesonis]
PAQSARMQPPIKSGKNNRLKSEGKLKEPKEQSNHRLRYAYSSSLHCLKDDAAMHKMPPR